MSSLTTSGLAVRYDTADVLVDLDLTVTPGEWVALIGPNGAGKSTLLRAATGVVPPSAGTILVGGDDPAGLRPRDLARRVAMVPQHPTLPTGTTVTDYALLGRTPYIPYLGVESRHDRQVVAGLLDRLDLAPLADRLVGQLSGGEVQRAVLVRALAQQAPLLLLDEPTSALDVGHQLQVLELVESLRHEHQLTVISAMHDLTLAGQFADRMVLLDRGRTVAQGSARTVLTEDRIRTHYDANVRVLVDDDGGVVVVPVRRRGRRTADPRPADRRPPATGRVP